MYQLFNCPGSGSLIVECLLELSGLPYRLVGGVVWEPGPDRDRLLEANPLGQVPTLILPDGTVMTESAAMALHLADRAPGAGFMPPVDHPARPRFQRWLVFLVANVYATFTMADEPSRWVSEESAQRELEQRVLAHRQRLWSMLEAEAAPDGWFLGDRWSAIDVFIAVMSKWRPRRAWFEQHCPKLHRIALAVEADPRLQAVFERDRRGTA